MTFRNNSVGFAQPTWTNRNTAIDCLLGSDASSVWENIVFENIEIYHVISPNVINVHIQSSGGNLKNITFKNITVKSTENSVYAFRMHYSANDGTISQITIENFNFCGIKITASNVSDDALFRNEATDYFGQLTVK